MGRRIELIVITRLVLSFPSPLKMNSNVLFLSLLLLCVNAALFRISSPRALSIPAESIRKYLVINKSTAGVEVNPRHSWFAKYIKKDIDNSADISAADVTYISAKVCLNCLTYKKDFHASTAGYATVDPDRIIYVTDAGLCDVSNKQDVSNIQRFDLLKALNKQEVKEICLEQEVPFNDLASKHEMAYRFLLHQKCPGTLVQLDERFGDVYTPETRNLLSKMVEGPSVNDGPGEIYAYCHVEASATDVKIG
jgi:hypothetical protein